MNRLLIMLTGVLMLSSSGLIAADLPAAIEGDDAFDEIECIRQNTDDCIQSVCMNSSELDCTSQCANDAKDKCKELSEE